MLLLAHLINPAVTALLTQADRPPPALAALIGALFLTGLITAIGAFISRGNQWDNWLRTAVAVFAISPILLTFPIFAALGEFVSLLVTKLLGPQYVGIAQVVIIVLAIGSIYFYAQKPSTGRLVTMSIFLLTALGTNAAQEIANWAVENVGLLMWNNVLIEGFNALRSIQVNVE